MTGTAIARTALGSGRTITGLFRRAKCAAAARRIYRVESGQAEMPAALARHRRSCLVCQAASSRQRLVLNGLASMRRTTEIFPGSLTIDGQAVAGLPEAPAPTLLRKSVVSAVSMVAIGAVGIALAGRRFRAQAG